MKPESPFAFLCRFQFQEAFSRAFKEVYKLPPGRKLMSIIRMQKEEKDVSTQEQIKGWILSGSTPELYELKTDENVFHSRRKPGLLYSKGEANEQHFGK